MLHSFAQHEALIASLREEIAALKVAATAKREDRGGGVPSGSDGGGAAADGAGGIASLGSDATTPGLPRTSSTASEALDEVEQLRKRNDRLKKVFKAQIDKFRDATYLLTGYKISLDAGSSGKADRLYLRSMYAEREDVRCAQPPRPWCRSDLLCFVSCRITC